MKGKNYCQGQFSQISACVFYLCERGKRFSLFLLFQIQVSGRTVIQISPLDCEFSELVLPPRGSYCYSCLVFPEKLTCLSRCWSLKIIGFEDLLLGEKKEFYSAGIFTACPI